MRPFYGSPDRSSTYLVLMAGLSLTIGNILERLLTTDDRTVTTPFEFSIYIGAFSARFHHLVASLIAIAILSIVLFFNRKTKTGKAMRAISQDREIASAMGIDVKKVSTQAGILGSCLASLAGMIYALSYSFDPTLIGGWILLNFALVTVGGVRSVLGSIIVGIIYGLVQATVTVTWNPIFAEYMLFTTLFIMLFIRPQGLFRK